jgi:hypothetical protein
MMKEQREENAWEYVPGLLELVDEDIGVEDLGDRPFVVPQVRSMPMNPNSLTTANDRALTDCSIGFAATGETGRYRFVYQGDGNLVLYDGGRTTWASNTAGRAAGVAIMQGDGNLVIYTPGPRAIWASNTAGHNGSGLVVQDDGNTVIYDPGGHAIWATNTWVAAQPAPSSSAAVPEGAAHATPRKSSAAARKTKKAAHSASS